MSGSIRLRDYQRAAIDDLTKRWDAGAVRVPLVLATGLGKTVIFSTLIAEWLAKNPGRRALVIAHTDELVEQASKALRAACPGLRVGIVKGPMNSVMADVIVSSRQTLAGQKRRDQIKRVGLIVIDEAHHAIATNTYGKILRHFNVLECQACKSVGLNEWCEECGGVPLATDVKVAGFTATLARSDKAKLSSVWEECTFKRDILFGIRRGYLLDVRGERVVVDQLDMRNVGVSGGDYSLGSLGEEIERSFAVETIAKEYVRVAHDRKGIAFWPLVSIAEHAARVFNEAGIPSAVVHGAMDRRERKQNLADLRSGKIQVIHNAMVLTEGFDDPTVECVVIGRPTKSAPLYQQMVGRALRPDLTIAPADRRPALVIDVTGAGEQHDLRSLIDLSPERRLQEAYDRDPDLTLSELDDLEQEILLEIDEELAGQRAGASWEFESEEYQGPTTTKTFDPLGRDKVWGRTSGGTYYVKSSVYAKADSFVFVVDSKEGDPGTYDIVQCSAQLQLMHNVGMVPAWARATEHVGLHLDMALSWGEELAGDAFNSRKSSWRRGEPSGKLRGMAMQYGINPAGMTSGELSEAVDVAIATRVIDPLVARVRASMQ